MDLSRELIGRLSRPGLSAVRAADDNPPVTRLETGLGFLLMALMAARNKKKLSIHESSVINFRVWITDVDASIMNHAAMMTVMEAGRIDLMVRTGFFNLARKHKWYFPSSAISVQFIRPLKIFQKAELLTRVFRVNDKWIYIEQKITRMGKDIAICIVKGTIKKGRDTMEMKTVIDALHESAPPFEGEALVSAFETENRLLRERLCDPAR